MEHNESMWKLALFYLGLSLLACHELDAVFRHEWRLLPILDLLSDGAGRTVFIAIHVPLFLVVFWLTAHASQIIRRRSQMAVDIFLIVHAIGHFLTSDHELYEFEGPLEWLFVYSGAAVSASHLFALRYRRNDSLNKR